MHICMYVMYVANPCPTHDNGYGLLGGIPIFPPETPLHSNESYFWPNTAMLKSATAGGIYRSP